MKRREFLVRSGSLIAAPTLMTQKASSQGPRPADLEDVICQFMQDCKRCNLFPGIHYKRDPRSGAYYWSIGIFICPPHRPDRCVSGKNSDRYVSLEKAMQYTIDVLRGSGYPFTPMPSVISPELDAAVQDLREKVDQDHLELWIVGSQFSGCSPRWTILSYAKHLTLAPPGLLRRDFVTLRKALSVMKQKRKVAARNRPKQGASA